MMMWGRILTLTFAHDQPDKLYYHLLFEVDPLPVLPTLDIEFDLWLDMHVTAYSYGDSTKAGYVYVTGGAFDDPVIADQLDLDPLRNISWSTDSTAGNTTGIEAASQILHSLSPSDAALHWIFTSGVPQVFYIFCQYYSAIGGTMYSDGETGIEVSKHGAGHPPSIDPAEAVDNVVVVQHNVTPSSCGIGQTIAIGSVTITWTAP